MVAGLGLDQGLTQSSLLDHGASTALSPPPERALQSR